MGLPEIVCKSTLQIKNERQRISICIIKNTEKLKGYILLCYWKTDFYREVYFGKILVKVSLITDLITFLPSSPAEVLCP